ncbi:hypothetical protein CEXT_260501 [Caerostris extrusa]|uniref:Uncharacterized protein n=1 Tax=Caerostris extrusa TaxID=172846 RepID=A0AAV4UFP6_CAEEX|nr:hypothetical protein CEXT_260501 [Caerostris extrusa]
MLFQQNHSIKHLVATVAKEKKTTEGTLLGTAAHSSSIHPKTIKYFVSSPQPILTTPVGEQRAVFSHHCREKTFSGLPNPDCKAVKKRLAFKSISNPLPHFAFFLLSAFAFRYTL